MFTLERMGFPDHWISDDFGHVWNNKTEKWIGYVDGDYKKVGLYRNGRTFQRKLHRIVAWMFLGEPPEGKSDVLHAIGCPRYEDGHKSCRPEHLRYGNDRENYADTRAEGHVSDGWKHGQLARQGQIEVGFIDKMAGDAVLDGIRRKGRRVLSDEEVAVVKRLLISKPPSMKMKKFYIEVGTAFGVGFGTIRNICIGAARRFVPPAGIDWGINIQYIEIYNAISKKGIVF